MGRHRSTFVAASAILAGLFAASCATTAHQRYEPKYVTRATAEDCAVIVQVAKVMIGPNAKGLPIVPSHQMADGGEYQETCAWKRLGVGNPRDPKSGEQSFVIYKPIYQPPGDTAEVTVDIAGAPGKSGQLRQTSYASCRLKRTGDAWAVQRCARNAKAD
jgi:hypothetical protein